MEIAFSNMFSDQMLKTCRELIPVTRRINENDSQMVMDCFHKFTQAYISAEGVMAQPAGSSAELFNSEGTKSSKREN